MSSSIFDGFKDGVSFAIVADYQVIIYVQIYPHKCCKHAAIHGKAHLCDVIF